MCSFDARTMGPLMIHEKLSFKTFVHDKCLVLSRDAEYNGACSP
jgi:hypothetical protein